MNAKEDELQDLQEELEKYQSVVHTLRTDAHSPQKIDSQKDDPKAYLLQLSNIIFANGRFPINALRCFYTQ